jgi:hypothetical protein
MPTTNRHNAINLVMAGGKMKIKRDTVRSILNKRKNMIYPDCNVWSRLAPLAETRTHSPRSETTLKNFPNTAIHHQQPRGQ